MSNLIQCRQCRVEKTCRICFEASTFARKRLASGKRSAICKVCYETRQGKTAEQINAELHEIAFELQSEQTP